MIHKKCLVRIIVRVGYVAVFSWNRRDKLNKCSSGLLYLGWALLDFVTSGEGCDAAAHVSS